MPPPEPIPAGFWMRYTAWSLDTACLLPVAALLGLAPLGAALANAQAALHALAAAMAHGVDTAVAQAQTPLEMALTLLGDPRLNASVDQLSAALTTLLIVPPLLYAVLACLWSLAFECSSWQATPGKRALGLRVTDAGGARLDIAQALIRFAAAGLSWLTLNLGHAMVLFAPHLALHDRFSRTRVLVDPTRRVLPTWARLWLLVQAVAGTIACAWLLMALYAWMQSLLRQALTGP